MLRSKHHEGCCYAATFNCMGKKLPCRATNLTLIKSPCSNRFDLYPTAAILSRKGTKGFVFVCPAGQNLFFQHCGIKVNGFPKYGETLEFLYIRYQRILVKSWFTKWETAFITQYKQSRGYFSTNFRFRQENKINWQLKYLGGCHSWHWLNENDSDFKRWFE